MVLQLQKYPKKARFKKLSLQHVMLLMEDGQKLLGVRVVLHPRLKLQEFLTIYNTTHEFITVTKTSWLKPKPVSKTNNEPTRKVSGFDQELVETLRNHLDSMQLPDSIRWRIQAKAAILAEKFAPDLSWYVDVIFQLIDKAGDFVSDDIWFRVVQFVTNNEDLQPYAAAKARDSIEVEMQQRVVEYFALSRKSAALMDILAETPKFPERQPALIKKAEDAEVDMAETRYELSSRHRGPNQKGLPNKRIRKASEKKSSDVARAPEKNFECLSCDANVLITAGDKGWREYGSHVVLELFEHNEWKLSVKVLGVTRYSYKALQFIQLGSANRYTHAMMWKGDKDWILEFPDRSQWALFKEMHEECYNRNLRAASVKNIPIPGVHLIEENDDEGSEVTFVRSSMYFQQVETDFEMALNPSRVLYDMDSEDEQWFSNIRNSDKYNSDLNGITEEMFEKTMDLFEKAAYAKMRDQFTPHEIEELTFHVGPLGIVKVVYDHWLQRRQKKGMALIRHFQMPMWERYQQQLKEWEVAVTKNNISSNGCLDKGATLEKPPMFAFCLKPRGLESQNKGLKHRSQEKISVSGHSNRLRYHDSYQTNGRRPNGSAFSDERYPGHSYDSLDDSPLPMTSPRVFSQRDTASMKYYSMSNNVYYRNHMQKLNRSKSKKLGSFMHNNDSHTPASYSPRLPASSAKRNEVRSNIVKYDIPGHRKYVPDSPQKQWIEQLNASDLEEFRRRDLVNAAQRARKIAKLKRERAKKIAF
ncbi:hypothetical protein KIW84_044967 [Lathyrus oleraceus]|uniref:Enhancer of polycomb-like protein n=1 Tax=Pisum sativum TaxID=3888 RepID=A0A9D4XHS7_PEA|nr:hypothetical protein KIW84_044967 [Pisum sativum]